MKKMLFALLVINLTWASLALSSPAEMNGGNLGTYTASIEVPPTHP